MARVSINSALGGIHGTVGDMVIRRCGDGFTMYRKPVSKKPRTEGQLETQATFSGGCAYFKKVKATDPALLAEYKRRGQSRHLNCRQMALRDFFNPPTISGFSLRPGASFADRELVAYAHDDFEVLIVDVIVRDAKGQVVASGPAHRALEAWVFALPSALAPNPSGAVEIAATDRPGHTTHAAFDLSRPGWNGLSGAPAAR